MSTVSSPPSLALSRRRGERETETGWLTRRDTHQVKSGTKWQDLKDFVRSGTNVEIKRVGTYSSSWNQQSLGAWILVKGREDFERVSGKQAKRFLASRFGCAHPSRPTDMQALQTGSMGAITEA